MVPVINSNKINVSKSIDRHHGAKRLLKLQFIGPESDRNFFLIFLKIKENSRYLEISAETMIVKNYRHLVDMLRILDKSYLYRKFVFKPSCQMFHK
jgi:hypothetical protein